ncbi:MAG TPA: phenylalanine--tRNA ligase subunit alpha [Candidatus Nanoarchaeia archaeon]|nr:phenylalanine--tRNA ligase subunit alpha [Candidatus Nanoarchaeia archaeon]
MKDLLAKLHPLERAVLPHLKEGATLTELVETSGMQEIEVLRALQWLSNKEVLKLHVQASDWISLDVNGETALQQGLPERRFLKAAKEGKKTLMDIEVAGKLSHEEATVSIGLLRGKAAINIVGNEIHLTEGGEKQLHTQTLEEKFLEKLREGPIRIDQLQPEDKYAFEQLRKRKKIVQMTQQKKRTVELLELGKALLLHKIEDTEMIGSLTPEMIKQKNWKNKDFRVYDVKINVPKVCGGKRQPYLQFLRFVKEKLLTMGFIEMTGPIVDIEFYNFDSLFQPQNHPARTWTDTYRVKSPKYGDLPDKKIVAAVKAAHENGGKSDSKGWGYTWDPQVAKQLMPRAHGTAVDPRYWQSKDLKIPGKYFTISRCYRPDVIDASHGVEFNQFDGFIMAPGLSFRHLLGLLQQAVEQLTGWKDVMFQPCYYPFTEPSVQLQVKHPKFGWLELGGAGMGRPELIEPLGIKVPNIMWGLGIDRMAMLKLGINDIRELFSSDLDYLRKTKKVI